MTEYSVPIPKSFRQTDDQFATILLGAPDFEFLNSIGCSYVITLDMMMEALKQGIKNVSSRTKKPEALVLFQECLDEVNVIHALFCEDKIQEAKHRIQVAEQLFQKAGKARNKKEPA